MEEDAGGGPNGNQVRGATSFCDGGTVFAEDFLIDGMTRATEEEVGGLGAAFAEDDGEAFVEVVSDVGEFPGETRVGGVPGFFEAGADERKEEVRGEVIPGAQDVSFLKGRFGGGGERGEMAADVTEDPTHPIEATSPVVQSEILVTIYRQDGDRCEGTHGMKDVDLRVILSASMSMIPAEWPTVSF